MENNYLIKSSGEVISLRTGKVMKPFLAGKGYHCLKLWDGKKAHHRSVHRLVAAKYCKNRRPDTEVNHIDGNKLNNCASNLEWVTKSENGKHAYRTGLNWNNPVRGSKHGNSKLKEEDIIEITKLHKEGLSLAKIASLYPVTKATIWKITKNRNWRHAHVS